MDALLTNAFMTAFVAGTIAATLPLLLAGLGEQMSEKAGVLNLGLEGMMLAGAFVGFAAALEAGSFTAGFLAAGFQVLTRAMTADVADEVRLEQGKERSGLLYAITTLTSKISGAFAVFLTFTVLDRVGYNATQGAVNTPEAVRGLELAFLIGPIFFVAVGGLCFIGYKLGEERHGEIRRELDERDALYDTAPVIETLSSDPAIASPGVGPGKT